MGRGASVGFHLYDYSLGAILAGAEDGREGVRFALDEEYGVISDEIPSSGGGTRPWWRLTMPAAGHPLTIAPVRDVRDPEKWWVTWAVYGVTYRGAARGEVRVRQGQREASEAMRAAEQLVFGGAAPEGR